ncbi:MAG: hypothetical protein BWY21_00314 [Parcubacteria group bacterium ADurb.Bin216]|nr:MAG: hypothetical protein BWY21_00314 [Parcubacteria group bacterium ADurb.Bin216]
MINKIILLNRIARWIDDSLRVIGLIAILMFIKVNFLGEGVTLHIPNTPVFATMNVSPEIEEYLSVLARAEIKSNDKIIRK